jgi:hypothetical protein
VNVTAFMGTIIGLALLALTAKLAHDGPSIGALLSGIAGVVLFGVGVANLKNDNIGQRAK